MARGPGSHLTSWRRPVSGSTTTSCRPRMKRPGRSAAGWRNCGSSSELIGLEVVVEERAADPRSLLSVPWNLVYDERPAKHKAGFQTGKCVERWRPFWAIRYNLTSGRRVEPLTRLPVWDEPRVIAAISPDVYETPERPSRSRGWMSSWQRRAWCASARWTSWKRRWRRAIPGCSTGWAMPRPITSLGDGRDHHPSDLRNLLRSFDDRERPEGMLAFLNACQTAESGQTGSFLEVLHSFGFTGAIATERQTIDNFANEFGLAFLRGFLSEGKPLGELLHGLRLKMAPLGLLYGAHCPPEIRVEVGPRTTSTQSVPEHPRRGPASPGPCSRAKACSVRARRRCSDRSTLPAEPYRSLGYYDEADRALFTGRDADVVRFAATLDRPDTRILVLHGESGIGKSSFLRAGVIPYLEEECVGYRFLRRPDGAVVIIQAAKDLVGQLAQALLDMTATPLEYPTPDGELVTDRPPQAARRGPGAAGRLPPRSARPWRDDASLLATLLARMAAPLAARPGPGVDQAEELFTLARTPEEIGERDHALRMLQRVVDLQADVKLIVSLRTEYYGRLLDHLRAGRRDLTGVRDDLLRDFSRPP